MSSILFHIVYGAARASMATGDAIKSVKPIKRSKKAIKRIRKTTRKAIRKARAAREPAESLALVEIEAQPQWPEAGTGPYGF